MLLLFVTACNDIEDCQVNPYNDVLWFQVIYDEDEFVVAFDSIVIQGYGQLTGYPDTLLTSFQYSLPMDFENEQITYQFFTDSIDYFITLEYDKEVRIFDLSCDAAIRYFNLEIQETNLDSALIKIPELFENLNNLEIHF